MSEGWRVVEVNPHGIKVDDLRRMLEGVDPEFYVYFTCREHQNSQLVSGVNISGLQRWFTLLPVGQNYDYYKNNPECDYEKEKAR